MNELEFLRELEDGYEPRTTEKYGATGRGQLHLE